jgi:aminocarboxymuconate-semialdehyde decarboxylase
MGPALDMLDREAARAVDPKGVRESMRGTEIDQVDPEGDPHRDPVARVEAMKSLGFDAQVLIPDRIFANTHGAGPYTIGAPLDVRLAICRLFNNATSAAQAGHSGAFIGTMVVPFDNIPLACEEIRRGVLELGLRVLVLPFNWVGKNFDELELYPLWQTISDLDVTVFVHGITQGCSGNAGDHQPRYPAAFAERMRRLHLGTYMGFGMEYMMVLGSLTLGGVLDEFPKLKFCFFEAGASWMDYAMYACDRSFLIEPQCSRSATLPSELIQKHCLTAIEPMEDIAALVRTNGSERYFFGTDFPHPEFQTFHGSSRTSKGSAPGADAVLECEDLAESDKDNILGVNIVGVFG